MNTTAPGMATGFETALTAPGRAPDIPEADDTYGWLAGSWELDGLHYRGINIAARGIKGEAHFAWVLEGRAVQDVWIMPRRGERNDAAALRIVNMYGTTLRAWDASIAAWRISWNNPAEGHREQQIGRRVGSDIVQTGARADGTPTRWRYTEITPASFHWLGEALTTDGQTWKLEGEFLARRVSAPAVT